MEKREQKNNYLRNLFLNEFIKEILSNSLVIAKARSPEPIVNEIDWPELRKEIDEKKVREYFIPKEEKSLKLNTLPPVPKRDKNNPRIQIQNRKIVPRTIPAPRPSNIVKSNEKMMPSITRSSQKNISMAPSKSSQESIINIEGMNSDKSPISIEGFDKLLPILRDPAVLGIECTGADKPILVNNAGKIQPSRVLLSKEEIDKVLEEISSKTRIPLITGVFKAAFDRYIISAVISDYTPSKFTIEKKIMSSLDLSL